MNSYRSLYAFAFALCLSVLSNVAIAKDDCQCVNDPYTGQSVCGVGCAYNSYTGQVVCASQNCSSGGGDNCQCVNDPYTGQSVCGDGCVYNSYTGQVVCASSCDSKHLDVSKIKTPKAVLDCGNGQTDGCCQCINDPYTGQSVCGVGCVYNSYTGQVVCGESCDSKDAKVISTIRR